MIFLLDTNAISDAAAEKPAIVSRISKISSADSLGTCTIVRGELLFGIQKMPHGKRRRETEIKMLAVLTKLVCYSIPESAAEHYATIKLQCQRKGTPVDENDLWIAATTLAMQATLVSRDTDFKQVDGLQLEDWTQ